MNKIQKKLKKIQRNICRLKKCFYLCQVIKKNKCMEKGIIYLKQVRANGEVSLMNQEETTREDAIFEIDKIKKEYGSDFNALYLLSGNIKVRFEMRTVVQNYTFIVEYVKDGNKPIFE